MNEHFNRNDETLVELTLLGDGTAYEELVTRHQRAVMGTAYKVTKNKFSAEDASQDAFVSAWMPSSTDSSRMPSEPSEIDSVAEITLTPFLRRTYL